MYVFIILITFLLTIVYQNVQYGHGLMVKRNVKIKIERFIVGLGIILVLSLLCGFRSYEVGTDTSAIYLPYYYNKYCINNVAYEGTEYLFYGILKVGYFLFHSYTGVLCLISFLTLTFAFIGLSYFKNRVSLPLAMLIYVSFIYFESFNIMRQILALSIIVFAFRYLEKKHYFIYLLWCFVAAFVHNSSIVSIGLLVIYLSLKNKKVYNILFVLICLLPFLLSPIMNLLANVPVLSIYFERYKLELDFSIQNFSYIIYFSPAFVICLYFRKALIKKDLKNKFYLTMLLLVFICGLFKLYMVWISRLLYYFSFSVCILLPQCVPLCKNEQNGKMLKLFIAFYCLAYFILFYLVLGNGDIYPYVAIKGRG